MRETINQYKEIIQVAYLVLLLGLAYRYLMKFDEWFPLQSQAKKIVALMILPLLVALIITGLCLILNLIFK